MRGSSDPAGYPVPRLRDTGLSGPVPKKMSTPQEPRIPPNPHIPNVRIILKTWRSEHTQFDKLDIAIKEKQKPDPIPAKRRRVQPRSPVTLLFARPCG